MRRYFFLSLVICSKMALLANPEGGNAVVGSADIHGIADIYLNVKTSDRAIIEWNSFSIRSNETVRFIQPSNSSAVLNRVVGQDPSSILGHLKANGSVYLINPRGIVFGEGCTLDVASLVASTLDIPNDHFLNGKEILLKGDSTASLVNLGTIRVKNGNIILVAHRIENHGTIEAEHVALGAGHEILLQPTDKPSLYIKVSDLPADGIYNDGAITALTTELRAVAHPYSLGIQLEGSIDALNINEKGGEIFLSVENSKLEISKDATLQAPGGKISIVAKDSSVSSNGSLIAREGAIEISANDKLYLNGGLLDVSGKQAGEINISAANFLTFGTINADGKTKAGTISIKTTKAYIESKSSHIHADAPSQGGSITIQSEMSYFSSGTCHTKGKSGGEIHIQAHQIAMSGANIDARGKIKGGVITVDAASNEIPFKINPFCSIRADARAGGKVSLSSAFNIRNLGKVTAGQKGVVEMIMPDPPLEDPLLGAPMSSCIITTPIEFVDPHPTGGVDSSFGDFIAPLPNGNVVITKPNDNVNAMDSGAVYLYDGATGIFISGLFGSQMSDHVGSGTPGATPGVTVLTNGNYVVSSQEWRNGGNVFSGAATWRSSTTLVSDTVKTTNSIVGTLVGDRVSSNAITALTNGNCVIGSPGWNSNRGAATWMDGTTGQNAIGTFGAVTVGNSIVGTIAGDGVGSNGIFALSNGNCIFTSSAWNSNRGAATWMNGNTGANQGQDANNSFAAVSITNSIFGSTGGVSGDKVGASGVALHSNGNFIISSPIWHGSVGAATWMNGNTGPNQGRDANNSFAPVSDGTYPPASIANSIFGSSMVAPGDQVSISFVALSNGNCVISSLFWNSFTGAATWINGLMGTDANGNFAPVSDGVTPPGSMQNSIFGTNMSDFTGSTIVALTNGNCVIGSVNWNIARGAATWMNGNTGPNQGRDFYNNFGPVSNGTITPPVQVPPLPSPYPANSIFGTAPPDSVGFVLAALPNGNCIIVSELWHNFAGAATWMNGSTGQDIFGNFGPVSNGTIIPPVIVPPLPSPYPANSIFGTMANDTVGSGGATVLPNSNAIINSSAWPMATNVGAATWISGTTGQDALGGFNPVSAANSIIGSVGTDQVSSLGTVAISNNNFIVASPHWNADTGALSLGNGTDGSYCGTFGTITPTNSVIGPNGSSHLQYNGLLPASDTANQAFIYVFGNDGGQTRIFTSILQTFPLPPVVPPGVFLVNEIHAKDVNGYLIAITEAFSRWLPTAWGGYLEQDDFPPANTMKGLPLYPPSLVVFGKQNPPRAIHKNVRRNG